MTIYMQTGRIQALGVGVIRSQEHYAQKTCRFFDQAFFFQFGMKDGTFPESWIYFTYPSRDKLEEDVWKKEGYILKII